MTIFLSGLREASEIVLYIEEIGAVLKQDEQNSRHFYGCMKDRIVGNQTGISIFFKSVVIILFHRTIFSSRSYWKDILRLFGRKKTEAACL